MKKYILLSLALLANSISFANHDFVSASGRKLNLWGWDKKEKKYKHEQAISRYNEGKKVRRNAILSIACSPNGLFFVSGSRDEIEVYRWDEKKQEYRCIQIISDRYEGNKEKRSYIRSSTFSPDSQTFISGSCNETIKVWSWNKKEKIWKHKQTLSTNEEKTNEYKAIFSVAFSSDGLCFISCSLDGTIKIWFLDEKEKIWKHKQTLSANGGDRMGHNAWITSVGFNPNGKYFASGSEEGKIKVWDRAKKEDRWICKQTLSVSEGEKNGHKNFISSIVFNPDGLSFVSTSLDNTIKIWGWNEKKKIWKHKQTLSGHKNFVYSVSFCPDGLSFISGSRDGTIKVWGWDKKKKRWKHKETLVVAKERKGHSKKDGVLAVAFIQKTRKQMMDKKWLRDDWQERIEYLKEKIIKEVPEKKEEKVKKEIPTIKLQTKETRPIYLPKLWHQVESDRKIAREARETERKKGKLQSQILRLDEEIRKKKNEWLKKLYEIEKISKWLSKSKKKEKVKKQALAIAKEFYECEEKKQRLEQQLDSMKEIEETR